MGHHKLLQKCKINEETNTYIQKTKESQNVRQDEDQQPEKTNR